MLCGDTSDSRFQEEGRRRGSAHSEGGSSPSASRKSKLAMGVVYLRTSLSLDFLIGLRLQAIGMRTVMITGDNPLTAAAI